MNYQSVPVVSRQAIPFDRIPLSDDWLRWDPETIHTYPEFNTLDGPGGQTWETPAAELGPREAPFELPLGAVLGSARRPRAALGEQPALVATARTLRALLRHPAAEVPYYLGLGFAVGLVCAATFLGIAVLFTP